jgi:hypothetical protein
MTKFQRSTGLDSLPSIPLSMRMVRVGRSMCQASMLKASSGRFTFALWTEKRERARDERVIRKGSTRIFGKLQAYNQDNMQQKQPVNVGGQMLQVRVARNMGLGDGWGRQTQAKDSSYESEKHGIWEDKVSRSDRDPMRQLVSQLRRAGVTMAGMRLDQHDPHIRARNFLAGQARADKQFGMLWNSMSPRQCNQLVEALASQIK